MKNIDDYISESRTMENVSDGGSAAFCFGDEVLVKYTSLLEYCRDPRQDEERIREAANNKNKSGVRTPIHKAIKRESDDVRAICWVLQERARGESFTKYTPSLNDAKTQLEMQKKLLCAPLEHYTKCILDLIQLKNMGIELKPKNIFYDDSLEGGGFTFIDLLGYDETPADLNKLEVVLWIDGAMGFVYNATTIYSYVEDASLEEKECSEELRMAIKMRIFEAMEKCIPGFLSMRRWVLRTYNLKELEYFRNHGVDVGDLNLTAEEQVFFEDQLKRIVEESIDKIRSGSFEFWQIEVNEIRNDLLEMGLPSSWMYHEENKREYDSNKSYYSYSSDCTRDLNEAVNQMFEMRLDQIASVSSDKYIIEAKKELEKERVKRHQMLQRATSLDAF